MNGSGNGNGERGLPWSMRSLAAKGGIASVLVIVFANQLTQVIRSVPGVLSDAHEESPLQKQRAEDMFLTLTRGIDASAIASAETARTNALVVQAIDRGTLTDSRVADALTNLQRSLDTWIAREEGRRDTRKP